ncbi:MAG: hypothetical protein ACAH83_17060 [Alphaproteobacteria bacterium]
MKDNTTMGRQRTAFNQTVLLGLALYAGMIVAPVAATAAGAYSYFKISGQEQSDVEQKATRMWQENGYEVTGFKSYEPGAVVPSITLKVTRKADGQKFDGTASCAFSCKMSKLATATP